MVPAPRWWLERSRAERFDITLRWPLYALCCMEPLLALLITFGEKETRVAGVVVFLAVTVLQAGANVVLLRAGIGSYLGGSRPSKRLLAVATALAVVVVPAAALAFPRFTWSHGESAIRLAVLLMAGGSLTLALSPLLRTTALVGFIVVCAVVVSVLTGQQQQGFSYFYSIGAVAFTCRVTVWTLGLGWEIDRSRTVTAQLAIAEERLRFARDLHDALGRNLSLVAVQSELAAALATRGDAGAAEQMLDVRRIAHDSLREMRAVVSGYRSTDLSSELAGAQSVLRAAGVDCRVIGDGSGLPDATQAALSWVVREATTNVIHHTNATSCKIELDLTSESTILRMENDGVAKSPASGWHKGGAGLPAREDGRGTGLVGLRERLSEVGGTLTVEEHPGRFVLVARLPAAP
ncbi:histidine kinase [Kribbella sancticallisti]|uniref:Histidine kinase n=1 Tax=Kribbella sancticallisti TaxID=460087 RepID=A0ABP4QGJ1_9ACTN